MNRINQVSNFEHANMNSMRLYDKPLLISTRKHKKYMILNDNNKYVHFGSIFYEDFLKHKDIDRQMRYIKRFQNLLDSNNKSLNNQYSPYNLSLYILWM